jgi:hypothetical protein
MDLSESVFQAQVADYISARDEVIGAIANQHMALTFGTGALVAAFGGAFVAWTKPVAPIIFIGIVPMSWWIFTMWLGEVVRMLRAVEFCGEQEEMLNESVRRRDPSQPKPLRLEGWRRQGPPWRTILWTYVSVGILILVTNVAALACWSVTACRSDWTGGVIIVTWAVVLLAGVPFARWVLMTFQRWASANVGMQTPRYVEFFERLPVPFSSKRDGHSR